MIGKRFALPIILCTLLFNLSLLAQVIETSKGKIEFIGLEKWTPQLIQEKLGYDSPDQLHFCATALKQKLGFPDVSVFTHFEGNSRYKVITVVEPQYSNRVRFKSRPAGSVSVPSSWEELITVAEKDYGQEVAYGLLGYGKRQQKSTDVDKQKDAPAWWQLLDQRRTQDDYKLALRVLPEDRASAKRIVAAAVLMNFPQKDGAWQALMDGLRDPEDMVIASCMHALKSLADYSPRPVNWVPVADSIRHILNGTSLFGLPFAIDALLKTDASTNLAKPLLKDEGGRILLSFLRAERKAEKERSRQLLVRLSGKDFGYDISRWSEWIKNVK